MRACLGEEAAPEPGVGGHGQRVGGVRVHVRLHAEDAGKPHPGLSHWALAWHSVLRQS